MENTLEEIKKKLNVNEDTGLTPEQVEENSKLFGNNELKGKKKKGIIQNFFEQFRDILIIILLICAIVSVIVDPDEWIESLIILIVIILNATLGVIQEVKAEKSLEALKNLSSLNCKVLRNGILVTIDTKNVVVGDIIVVEAGDFVPADARILTCSNLMVDESALTGESVAVCKTSEDLKEEPSGLGDMKNCLFSSTFVSNGKATAVVTSVGMNTEIGKIAGSLIEAKDTKTPLQHRLTKVGTIIGIMSLFICVIVFAFEWIVTKEILASFKMAVVLAVAAIPEGLAAVVTVILAIGVQKMAKQNAIVKKLPAVETLGNCSVICSDKTGTLTQNKMTVQKLYRTEIKDLEDLAYDEQILLKNFAICCDANITNDGDKVLRIGDPTELALLDVNNLYGIKITEKRILDFPFDSDRKLMTTVIKSGDKYLAITKGAPDIVLNNCVDDESVKQSALKAIHKMSEDALRVLALAEKYFDKLPTADDIEKNMNFCGLVGMIDPAREEVIDAIKVAHFAGIRTVMITGDHVVTASAIARKLGIMLEGDLAISSADLAKLSDEELIENIEKYKVFARVSPEDKVRIVNAWQFKSQIVAMTGDGVNDAPALKRADIGCAMGITGTDVSKESADMILTDDNYTTIVTAVKQGRGIYNNIQKCVKYLLSSNIGEVFVVFMASVISMIIGVSFGVPLSPIHLLWINLITDSLPVFGLGMDNPDDSIMTQKPRPKHESFLSKKLIIQIVFVGFLIGVLSITTYIIGNNVYNDHSVGQTMAFLTLSTIQLFHSFNIKSDRSIFSKDTFKNKVLNISFIVGFALQVFIIYCPSVNSLFKLSALSLVQFLICIGISALVIVFVEIFKFIKKLKNR